MPGGDEHTPGVILLRVAFTSAVLTASPLHTPASPGLVTHVILPGRGFSPLVWIRCHVGQRVL